MYKSSLLLLFFILAICLSINAQSSVQFTGTEFLGRPTDNSITLNIIASTPIRSYIEYGTESGVYNNTTGTVSSSADVPVEIVISGLTADTKYYYRVVFSPDDGATWNKRDEHTFRTQRPPGSSFTFTIIADSHLGQYGGQALDERRLYRQTLRNVGQDQPDFHIDLGDTFAMDPLPPYGEGLGNGMTAANAEKAYLLERPEMGIISASVPIFLVIGNHENEEGWNWDDMFTYPEESLAVVGMRARKLYFPNPIPDGFYTGNEDAFPPEFEAAYGNEFSTTGEQYREDYYAWEWGDALFVVLDPYHYSMTWPFSYLDPGYGGEGTDGEPHGNLWDWTLGIEQYLWFKKTLEQSNAAYKFVFAHQVTGGAVISDGADTVISPYGRGGASAAQYFEWGGKNWNGTWGFDTQRPASEGWDKPIHQLMVENGVTAFFHGHDHIYARETVDGILYLECPKPDDAGYNWDPYGYGYNEGLYPNALVIPNSGHVRVKVSPDNVVIDYVRSYLTGDGNNMEIADSYIIGSVNDAPADSGGGSSGGGDSGGGGGGGCFIAAAKNGSPIENYVKKLWRLII